MRMVETQQGRPLEELITELYDQQGLTQKQVAARLGISEGALSRWMVTLGIPARSTGPRPAGS